ncbi:radical SAM protein [Clostridium sp. K25]|uniref:glycyl-radical enzyme activating protein n=1 Tax=Clostridium sp. K25 TaxID=1443109 RepID=UPI0004D8255E|nr:glycyl-radical enzyme activating protein [Clostridium sp. K25]KEI09804.1 radical SAM protein [Clostridium sp. K25]
MNKKDIKGCIFNIQKFSLNDGPGIRSIVFFKGCPMSCLWCSNPESQCVQPQIMYNKNVCVQCGMCKSVCSNYAINLKSENKIERDKCIGCGKCAEICPSEALVVSGESVTVGEVVGKLKKDSIYYRKSGGGVTLSGGEALLQPEFTIELLKQCKSLGWHTAIETAMYVSDEIVEKIVPYLDLILVDVKCMDSLRHKEFTGVDNEIILNNIRLSDRIAEEMIIRVPVIEGFNSDEKSIRDIAEFAKTLKKVKRIDLLPYHSYGENKYETIGRNYFLKNLKPPSNEKMNYFKKIVQDSGLFCSIGA